MEKMLTDEEIVEKKVKNTKIIDKRILLALQMLMDHGKGEDAVITFNAGGDSFPALAITVEDLFSLIHRMDGANAELQKQVDELKEQTSYLESVADTFQADYKNAKADGVRELLQELIEMEIKLDPLRSGIRYKTLIVYAEENGVEVE